MLYQGDGTSTGQVRNFSHQEVEFDIDLLEPVEDADLFGGRWSIDAALLTAPRMVMDTVEYLDALLLNWVVIQLGKVLSYLNSYSCGIISYCDGNFSEGIICPTS